MSLPASSENPLSPLSIPRRARSARSNSEGAPRSSPRRNQQGPLRLTSRRRTHPWRWPARLFVRRSRSTPLIQRGSGEHTRSSPEHGS